MSGSDGKVREIRFTDCFPHINVRGEQKCAFRDFANRTKNFVRERKNFAQIENAKFRERSENFESARSIQNFHPSLVFHLK